MVETTVVRTIRVKGTSEGIEKLTGDLTKLAGAQDNVAVVSEQTARRMLSAEAAWKRQTMQVDENARAQSRIADANKVADRALQQGIITQQQHADRLTLIQQRYGNVIDATDKFGKSTGLARHELINLGRQAQDVGVSLVSGQSPFMVLAQQGSQIADVFISSGKSVGSFFSQAVGWAGRFLLSTTGVVAGITAIGGAALYMGSSFAAAQREIDRALSGAGAASRLTRSGVNRIAEAAAGGGMSIDDARASVLEFAKTGRIYADNIGTATNVTREFAQALGVDTAQATKQLAAALSDPAKGALELNKSIQFLDADTLKYIQTLQSMGQTQQAQNALMVALLPSLQRQNEQVSDATRRYNAYRKEIEETDEALKRLAIRGLERVTGIQAGGFTDEERLAAMRARQQDAAERAARGVPFGRQDLAAITAEVERLEKKLGDLAKQTEAVRFAQLSLDAQAFGRSLDQTGTQIEALTQGLAKIAQYQAERLNQGLGVDPAMERQAQIGSTILAQTLAQEDAEQRKRQVLAENALIYQDTSAAIANQRELMDAQLAVAQAVTEQDRMAAEHNLTLVQLKQQGLNTTDRTVLANGRRLQQEVEINARADRMLHNLQQQGELLNANTDRERAAIQARHTYQDLIARSADADKARAVANQQHSNALREIAKQEEAAIRRMEEQIAGIRTAADAWELYRQKVVSWSVANDEAGKATRRMAEATEDAAYWAKQLASSIFEAGQAALIANTAFVPFATAWASLGPTSLGTGGGPQGKQGLTQFNPEGYKFSYETPLAIISRQIYGEGGVDEMGRPNAQGLEFQFNKALGQAGGNIGSVVNTLLGGGVMTQGGIGTSPQLDTQKLGLITRAIDLLSTGEQAGAIQGLIGQLSASPASLQTNEMIKQLNDKLQQLTNATNENTEATQSMTDVLSPFYSSDPRRTYLGFRAFAGGGIMTDQGAMPMQGGIATSRQFAMFGEGSVPEAFVPVPSGRIPVELKMPANSNRPINVIINVAGNADADTVSALKQTAFQQAQSMRRVMR